MKWIPYYSYFLQRRVLVFAIFVALIGAAFCLSDKSIAAVLNGVKQLSPSQRQELAGYLHKVGIVPPQVQDDDTLHKWVATAPCSRVTQCVYNNTEPLFCMDTCTPGSLKIDPYISDTIQFQEQLQSELSIPFLTLPATHNSAITLAYGFGIEEVRY